MAPARLSRVALAGLLGVALAAGGPPHAVAKKPRPACQKFAGSHKDLAGSPTLVAAALGDDETGRIAACVLPRGKVRTLASWDDGLSRDRAHVSRRPVPGSSSRRVTATSTAASAAR